MSSTDNTTTKQPKLPQAGEWWLNRRGKISFVAFNERSITSTGSTNYPLLVYTDSEGNYNWLTYDGKNILDTIIGSDNDLIRHLPDCTGFNWVEEVFPQYYVYVSESVGYYECLSKDHVDHHDRYGTVVRQHSNSYSLLKGKPGIWKQVTKEEALTRVYKPTPTPVFDPKTFTSDWGLHFPMREQLPPRVSYSFHQVSSDLWRWDGKLDNQVVFGGIAPTKQQAYTEATQWTKDNSPKTNKEPVLICVDIDSLNFRSSSMSQLRVFKGSDREMGTMWRPLKWCPDIGFYYETGK